VTKSIEAQRIVSGFRVFQMVVAACRLEIPDLVATGPKTAEELAASTGMHAPSLRRILRGLEAWSFFEELADGRFAATPLSDNFRSDIPGFRNQAIMLSEGAYPAWGELMYTLRTGNPAFDHMHGKGLFEKLAEDPDVSSHFNAAMVEISTRVGGAFVAAYDFAGVRTVVDVGGGNGALLVAVLQAHPEMRGILFDLAQGLAGARERLVAAGVADRVALEEGSFFEGVPSSADLYLLKFIVHDWDDDRSVAILQTCRRAMAAEARLVILERRLPERIESPDEALSALMGDVHMMVMLGGKERTANEYRDLLARAGLRMTGVVPVGSDFCAVEAVAAG
jgi:ubiquinone/menaquinone biosynthesis C-methylase UbiE